MGATLAEVPLALTSFQWICIVLLIGVAVFYFVWKKKQE